MTKYRITSDRVKLTDPVERMSQVLVVLTPASPSLPPPSAGSIFSVVILVLPLLPEDCDQEKPPLFLFWLTSGSRLMCCNITFIFWEKSSRWPTEMYIESEVHREPIHMRMASFVLGHYTVQSESQIKKRLTINLEVLVLHLEYLFFILHDIFLKPYSPFSSLVWVNILVFPLFKCVLLCNLLLTYLYRILFYFTI